MSQGYEPREGAKSAGMPRGHPSYAAHLTNPSTMSEYPHLMGHPHFTPHQPCYSQVNTEHIPNRSGGPAPPVLHPSYSPRPAHSTEMSYHEHIMHSYGNPQGNYYCKCRDMHRS